MLSIVFLAAWLQAVHSAVQCPDGWTEYFGATNKCIRGFSDEKGFIDALEYCMKISPTASLVSIHNAFQNAHVASVSQQANPHCFFWLGLADFDDKRGYQWTDGADVDYTNWAPEYPGEYTEGTAALIALSERNRWISMLEISEKHCFVCEQTVKEVVTTTTMAPTTATTTTKKPTTTTWKTTTTTTRRPTTTTTRAQPVTTTTAVPTTTTPLVESCKPGWSLFEHACYYHSGDNWMPQQDAENFCISEGSHLASVLNQKEQDFINTNYGALTMYWIGLVKTGSVWTWIDGSKFNYANWYEGYPDATSDACVIGISESGKWANYRCTLKYTFVCKHRLI